jgi:hypothetical protein
MTKDQVRNAIRSLQLHINHGIGTADELEDAQVQLDMYLDIYDEMNQE